jgi:hypothetical protein
MGGARTAAVVAKLIFAAVHGPGSVLVLSHRKI